jgi:hypothetical protein
VIDPNGKVVGRYRKLFPFHPYEQGEAINERWADPDNIDSWSQLVIKHPEDTIQQIHEAPRSGIWHKASDGGVSFLRPQIHRRTVESEEEAFFLRIGGKGDYFYEGADLGILVTPGRLMTDDFELNDRAKAWIAGIRAQYLAKPLSGEPSLEAQRVAEAGGFKFL